jgi:class 3 adenylate cyclase/CheY-like chemotaxis protein
MAKLLVVEKSAALREFLRLHLETARHSVVTAEDAGAAERVALAGAVQLIVAGGGNESLPGLERLRVVAPVPLILIATRGDADAIAEARTAGAADYLVLPVTREALLRSVAAHLGAGAAAAPAATTDLRGVRYSPSANGSPAMTASRSDADAGEGDTLPPFDPVATGISPRDGQSVSTIASQEARAGTVLFADIRSFSALAETLTTQHLADLLNAYFVRACEPILQQGGWIVKLLGDGMLAMFEPLARAPNHAERGLKAGLFLCVVAQRFGQWLEARFPDRTLPDFAVGIGVHTGDVMVCRINTGAGVDTTIIGDTVNVASRLEEQTKRLGASLVTSLDTLALAGPRFIPGKRGALLVRGRASPVEITEITGLRPRPNVDDRGLYTYSVIHEAVLHNTQIILRERDRVLAEPHRIRNTGQFSPLRPADSPVKIPGFRLLRRLGQGGMSRAFLAEYESTGATRVLKVLNTAEGGYELLRRFLQEYELIAQIRHPHVATIFDRGQTDTHAYIVMEYFAGGDLRQRLEQPLAPEQALEYLRQIAEALVAIHARGIVHRDLKPDNIMLRENGTLVLSDFGIAKDLSRTVSHTRYGEGLGTPYYLSPEQAQGGKVDQRSDLYSLGVMLFEMLTGDKPYHADDGPELLRKHVQEPVPTLPAQLARLQPLLQRLMAKTLDERFATSQEALQAIRALMT